MPYKLLIFFFMFSSFLSAQYTKTAACKDNAFDRKVNGYLSYSAPVISVVAAHANKSQSIFLDAREFEEYKISHIPGARYIGYDDFDIKSIKDVAKNSNIVVYCSIGYRSEKIATKLKKEGYSNVYNLYGSLFEWANEGFELSDVNGQKTKKIHTYNKSWSKWVLNPTNVKVW